MYTKRRIYCTIEEANSSFVSIWPNVTGEVVTISITCRSKSTKKILGTQNKYLEIFSSSNTTTKQINKLCKEFITRSKQRVWEANKIYSPSKFTQTDNYSGSKQCLNYPLPLRRNMVLDLLHWYLSLTLPQGGSQRF